MGQREITCRKAMRTRKVRTNGQKLKKKINECAKATEQGGERVIFAIRIRRHYNLRTWES